MRSNNEKKILIVDDDPNNLKLMLEILKKEGYQASPVSSGKQVIAVAQQNRPDLILLDIMMPEMDGFEVCQQLKSDENLKHIPIIFISALADTEDIIKAFKLGGVDYIKKPFVPSEVLVRVKTHLALSEQHQQIKEELEVAKSTQLAHFPRIPPQIPQLKLVRKYTPVYEVGGDFYDILELGDSKFGIMLGEVTGHGVAAAMVSFMIFGIFKDAARNHYSSKFVVRRVNDMLGNKLPEAKFATMFYGIYDASKHRFTCTTAGFPPGFLIHNQSPDITKIQTRGIVLGAYFSQLDTFEEKEIHLVPGDKVLLFTDGLFEVRNSKDEFLGIEGLQAFLEQNYNLPISELVEKIYEYGRTYSQQERFEDDCTIIGLEVTE